MLSFSFLLGALDGVAASVRTADDAARSSRLTAAATALKGDGVSILGCGDLAAMVALAGPLLSVAGQFAPAAVQAEYRALLSACDGYLRANGGAGTWTGGLNSYLAYQNTLTPFSALADPRLAALYAAYVNGAAGQLLTATNVFAPQTTFGAATVGSGAGAVTYVSAAAIPTANVGSVQGFTPAPGVTANVTTAINNTLTITVTGNGVSSAGVAFTGHTWTGSLSSLGAGASVALTPGVAGDRISAVTACAGSGAATAGAFSLVSVLERVVV